MQIFKTIKIYFLILSILLFYLIGDSLITSKDKKVTGIRKKLKNISLNLFYIMLIPPVFIFLFLLVWD